MNYWLPQLGLLRKFQLLVIYKRSQATPSSHYGAGGIDASR